MQINQIKLLNINGMTKLDVRKKIIFFSSIKKTPFYYIPKQHRDRLFDRITFFRNLSIVLSKFVSKEKICTFKYRPRLIVLLNTVLSNFERMKFKGKKRQFFFFFFFFFLAQKSDHRTTGPSDHQTIGPQDHRTISKNRTIGPLVHDNIPNQVRLVQVR